MIESSKWWSRTQGNKANIHNGWVISTASWCIHSGRCQLSLSLTPSSPHTTCFPPTALTEPGKKDRDNENIWVKNVPRKKIIIMFICITHAPAVKMTTSQVTDYCCCTDILIFYYLFPSARVKQHSLKSVLQDAENIERFSGYCLFHGKSSPAWTGSAKALTSWFTS